MKKFTTVRIVMKIEITNVTKAELGILKTKLDGYISGIVAQLLNEIEREMIRESNF
jgi:hypothetical protein